MSAGPSRQSRSTQGTLTKLTSDNPGLRAAPLIQRLAKQVVAGPAPRVQQRPGSGRAEPPLSSILTRPPAPPALVADPRVTVVMPVDVLREPDSLWSPECAPVMEAPPVLPWLGLPGSSGGLGLPSSARASIPPVDVMSFQGLHQADDLIALFAQGAAEDTEELPDLAGLEDMIRQDITSA